MKRIASVIAVASSDMETYEQLHREGCSNGSV
ncbi:hypothetical protein SAMN06296378_0885 [Salinibacterium xinjiangense]|uniref:Uncharacterized protein n=1 Tax=Salinibacterium xinjiangense TaxID=386302 RepID=A0A2C8Z5P1_9MICO|nr:hypothetical protein SAMN06296378_0885 [Salinibacterium xinjiangense]